MLPIWSRNLRSFFDVFEPPVRVAVLVVEPGTSGFETKKRLLEASVPYIEVHLVTRVLAQPDNPWSLARLARYYRQ